VGARQRYEEFSTGKALVTREKETAAGKALSNYNTMEQISRKIRREEIIGTMGGCMD
jgi:hypothetical protein